MNERLRTTITVRLRSANLEAFRKAVIRFLPTEHKWRRLHLDYVSVIGDGSRPVSKVRVIVDTLGDPDETDDACEAAVDATVRALLHIGETDTATQTQVEVVD